MIRSDHFWRALWQCRDRLSIQFSRQAITQRRKHLADHQAVIAGAIDLGSPDRIVQHIRLPAAGILTVHGVVNLNGDLATINVADGDAAIRRAPATLRCLLPLPLFN
ncbi:MAG: hypothetical protein E6R08_04115 [Nevskiaceae bacterium]|nr:MAG: hypothetical protein E6R08_04115 [Nevskiaceae bacterium]